MDKKNYINGIIYGTLAFTIWGILPLYWKAVNIINPYQIFLQRVVWSFIFIAILIIFTGKSKEFTSVLKKPKLFSKAIAPSLFISINWLLYIWAVNNNYVIETSLGYYLNPLVLTLLGRIFLKEHLNKLQIIGISFASIGVLLQALFYGRIPYIAIVLAVSFAIYGLLKKTSPFESLHGLGYETLIIGIPSVIILSIIEGTGKGISGNINPSFWFLIALSGIITATPLVLYGASTRKIPLNVVGFLQYIAPTIALFLGIFVFKEPFNSNSLISFVLIWIGLAFFSYSQYKLLKNSSN
ncbi:EamA family transporter RarD [Helicovermis profundi]